MLATNLYWQPAGALEPRVGVDEDLLVETLLGTPVQYFDRSSQAIGHTVYTAFCFAREERRITQNRFIEGWQETGEWSFGVVLVLD